MAGVNGKNKGSVFERKIANLLSARFKDYLGIPLGFRRNPDSGAFFGGSNQSRTEKYDTDFAIFGDLICPKTFLYSIECKHYKSPPSFQSVLKNEVTQWDKWLLQSHQDAAQSEKTSMLIIKYNNVDEFAIVDDEFPSSIRSCFKYKTNYVYRLEDILTLDNSYFFKKSS